MRILLLVLIVSASCFAVDVTFKNPDVKTKYSEKLQSRIDSGDELLKEFNGDGEFQALLTVNPELWVITNLDTAVELATKLKLELIYIDGINEEAECKIIPSDSLDARLEWNVELGIDFISGGASIIPEHIKICFERIKNEVGYAYYNKQKEIVKVLPEQIAKDLDVYRVNGEMKEELRLKVLDVQKEFLKTAQCPTTIESYLVLMDIYNQMDSITQDLFQADNDLNFDKNGGKKVTACAFSREWNERYSEDFGLNCNMTENSCQVHQSKDGDKIWVMNFERNTLEFQGETFLFMSIGEQSIHEGGEVMDLQLIPLSKNLYIEAYLDNQKKPISLGLLTIAQ